jgi:toxin YoeB
MQHPTTGTGHPEPLKGKPEGRWSRRITDKHRLVYRIYEDTVVVLVLSAYGHYGDK